MILRQRDWPYPCETCGCRDFEVHVHDPDGRRTGPVVELTSLSRCMGCGPPCDWCELRKD